MYAESDICDMLFLTDVFKNFRNMCLKIYELDPTLFLTASLAWQVALKKIKVKLDLLTDMLMVEKGIGGGMSLYLSIYER